MPSIVSHSTASSSIQLSLPTATKLLLELISTAQIDGLRVSTRDEGDDEKDD